METDGSVQHHGEIKHEESRLMGYILDMGIEFNFDGIDNQQSQMVGDGEEWKKWYKLFMLRQDQTNCRCCCLGFVSSFSNIVCCYRALLWESEPFLVKFVYSIHAAV